MRPNKMHSRSAAILLILVGTAIICVCTTWSAIAQNGEPRITGTYTNMRYNEEAGDLLGEEIKIVPGSEGYQGAFQVAQGAPEDLIIVEVKVAGSSITFTIADSSTYAGEFRGKVEKESLRGEFRFKSGAVEKAELRRARSYWD